MEWTMVLHVVGFALTMIAARLEKKVENTKRKEGGTKMKFLIVILIIRAVIGKLDGILNKSDLKKRIN